MIFTTGQSAFITAVNSTTSLTASVSQTVPSTSYQMAGQTTSAATCMDAIGNFGAKNLYVYSTLNLPNGTFSIGGNTAFSGAFTFTGSLTGNTGVTFPTSGTLATTSQLPTPSALTKTDDTNVTLTLGGTPTTALLQATSLTLGWTGQLSAARGGTGANNTATSGTILRGNGTNFVPTTATYPSTFVINDIPYASSANVLGVITAAANSVLAYNGSSIPSATATLPSAVQNNITAVNSAANTLSIGGSTKTFTSGAVNVPSATNVSSWTPGISFGNGTTGLTYGFQSGQYSTTVMPNGQIKTECWASLGLSAKGTSTGIARITGFPTSTGSNGAIYIFASAQENISTVAGSTLFCDMSASGTTAVIRSYSNNAANTTLSDTNFTNNSVLKFYAVYWNN
jgi:hypothetical protein